MPIYTDVVASRIEKYRAQLERDGTNDADIDGAIFRYVFCQLVDAAFGGGGGGGSTSSATIALGINQSSDIDTIATRLTSIDANLITQSGVVAAIQAAPDIDTIIARLVDLVAKPDSITQLQVESAINASVDIDTLIARLASIDTKLGIGIRSDVTISRPANTTPYIANSVWGGSFQLSGVNTASRDAIITGISVIFSNTTLPSGMGAFRLYLYSTAIPSAVADGGAFSLPPGDRASCLTPGGIALGSAVVALGGGSVVLDTFVNERGSLNRQISIPASGNIFGYLVNISAHTPVSAATAQLSLFTAGV